MRWAPNARGRLERAASELFSEQGYSATTVPQITARAGLTTRTFFRYFADKREVIFGGNEIPENAARLVQSAPPSASAVDIIRFVLDAVAQRFEGQQHETAQWRRMISDNAELRDRDARKRADLVMATRDALVQRGESVVRARVLAELGAVIFHVALDEWVAEQQPRPLTATISEVIELLERTCLVDARP